MQTIQELETKAEKERCARHRQKFLELQKEIEIKEQEEVLSRHKQQLEIVKKDFPVGFYIPELHASVKEIKDGCGTKTGWVDIYLTGHEKSYRVWDLRKKIRQAREEKEARECFGKLKCSDSNPSLYIGKENLDTLDMLIRVMDLDLPTTQEVEESLMDYPSGSYEYAMKQAKEDGFTDDEAEVKAQEAEQEERDDEFKKYVQRIVNTINYLLNFHDIELEVKKKRYYLTSKSWKETAEKVKETINGMGPFWYDSLKEFKEVGPYKSYCAAVCSHLHWLKDYPQVYGETSYRRVYER